MRIYNTLTRQEEDFRPTGKVKMFVCGPTVYDFVHIGNARTFVFFDFVAKYLRYRGHDVEYVQNITDIDDKIINKARETGKTPPEIAREFEHAFRNDMQMLGVTSVSKYPRATDFIPEIISQVKRLIDKKHAYLIQNDGWYFDIKSFPKYGALSGRTVEKENDAVSRIDENSNKRNMGDFCLWKLSKMNEPAWDFETGEYLGASNGGPAFAKASAGKPGWHIEDTAITEKLLGPRYDIHGGGQDLIFPHHEAEIAQQCSAADLEPEEFVKYWMHAGFLVNKDSKMSKSKGNFMTLREALGKYPVEVLRFYFLSNHYRSPLDYSEEIIKSAEAAVARISEIKGKMFRYKGSRPLPPEAVKGFNDEKTRFFESIDDDFNLPKATGYFFNMIRAFNSYIYENYEVSEIAGIFSEILGVYDKIFGVVQEEIFIPEKVSILAESREISRKEKKYKEADKIRDEINNLGYSIDDTPYGPLIKKK